MNHCRTSTRARYRGKPDHSSRITRLTGFAILLVAAVAWPMAALAADPAVETQQNPAVVYIVLILLFIVLTSGIFFASPLRSRMIPSTATPARRARPAVPATTADQAPAYVAPTDQVQANYWTQSINPTQPAYPGQPIYPTQPTYAGQPQLAPPSSTPWSTGNPETSGPWTPTRRGPDGQS